MREPEFLLNRLLRLTEENPDIICGYFLDWLDDHGRPVQLMRQKWIESAKRIGFALRERGVQPGDRVLLSLPTSPQFLISFLAIWWIGAIPVPLPEVSPFVKKKSFSDRFLHVIKDCTPKGIIALEFGRELLSKMEDFNLASPSILIWSYESLWEIGDSNHPLIQTFFQPTGSETAFIQYTSGSTGSPKGVIVTQDNLTANMEGIGLASQATSSDRFVSWLPLYHDMGLVGTVLWASYWNIPFYLLSPLTFLTNPSTWIKAVSDYKATISIAPNFAYSLCVRKLDPEKIPNLNLSHWRLAYNGAEPIDYRIIQKFEQKFAPYKFSATTFYPVYGMAEATLAISFPTPGCAVKIDRISRKEIAEKQRAIPAVLSEKDALEVVSVGQAIPNHFIKIKDPSSDEILQERQVGEICFYGASVTPGYFNKGQNQTTARELRTGDLGYIADGNLFIVDRVKDLIKVAGVSYYPSDIESQLEKLPELRPGRVAAFEIYDAENGTGSLVIAGEVYEGSDLDGVRQAIKKNVFDTFGLTLKKVILSTEKIIPLTSSGKKIRHQCRDLFLN